MLEQGSTPIRGIVSWIGELSPESATGSHLVKLKSEQT